MATPQVLFRLRRRCRLYLQLRLSQSPPCEGTPFFSLLENVFLVQLDLVILQLVQGGILPRWWTPKKCKTAWWLNQPIWKICASQIGKLPQIGMKINNIWNHHLENMWGKKKPLIIYDHKKANVAGWKTIFPFHPSPRSLGEERHIPCSLPTSGGSHVFRMNAEGMRNASPTKGRGEIDMPSIFEGPWDNYCWIQLEIFLCPFDNYARQNWIIFRKIFALNLWPKIFETTT